MVKDVQNIYGAFLSSSLLTSPLKIENLEGRDPFLVVESLSELRFNHFKEWSEVCRRQDVKKTIKKYRPATWASFRTAKPSRVVNLLLSSLSRSP
jgi:hypothetical protein